MVAIPSDRLSHIFSRKRPSTFTGSFGLFFGFLPFACDLVIHFLQFGRDRIINLRRGANILFGLGGAVQGSARPQFSLAASRRF